MARMRKKGRTGAAKNYITRNRALKKLQVTLADFRRLCILKGIFPRQPKNVKKANRGKTAPTTFYYAKDIAYLQHEPVIQKLREHKTFAKKLSRAIGRKEWSLAKNLHDNKPVYKLDHIIKERYPTFTDSLKDIDDALSLLTLFANLPASERVSAEVVSNCAKLCAEWQLYVMKAKALRKVFLSIKGVYFQAEVRGQTITWLVPYMFTQNIPSDIDFRIMMTFLELYQTLLGFVLYKLYTDENLVYPPNFDQEKDAAGAGVGALSLDAASAAVLRGENAGSDAPASAGAQEAKKLSQKVIKKQIREISRTAAGQTDSAAADEEQDAEALAVQEQDDEFVEQPSKVDDADQAGAGLTTLAEIQAASAATEGAATSLFTPYVFYISRECPRPILEFVLKSFGASASKVGWDDVAGAGSAVSENDPRITHHIVDRPIPANGRKKYGGARTFVQPQWIVDCANARKLLPTAPYGPGQTLPPHLSPFVDEAEVARRGGYVPAEARAQLGMEVEEDGSDEDESSGEDVDENEEEADEDQAMDADADAASRATKKGKGKDKAVAVDSAKRPALAALLADPLDVGSAGLLDAAELEAEAVGGEDALEEVRTKHAAAVKAAKKQGKAASGGAKAAATKKAKSEDEEAKEMAQMMMSNRSRKLYNKLNYSANKRSEEKTRLEQKKKSLEKAAKKKGANKA
ncbi:mRNA-binding ribosome synthesis protein nop7 [Thecaphora frezii]